MEDILVYSIIAVVLLIIVMIVLTRVADGKLQALKPMIKEAIIKFEAIAQSEDLKHAGVKKMTQVCDEVISLLPSWCQKLIPTGYVEEICQLVYDEIKDKLTEEAKEYKDNYLTGGDSNERRSSQC